MKSTLFILEIFSLRKQVDYLKYEELDDLTKEGRKIFYAYIKKKGFHYSFLEKYGFIAD